MATTRSGTAGAVRIDGLRRLRRDFKALIGDLSDFKAANAKALAVIVPAASARAPRRSGRLAASIRGNRAANRATVLAGGASLPYAGPIHWGWPARHIEAQPFAADAAADTQPTWLPAYEADVQTAITRIAGNRY